jgi:hypothetical protein
MKNLNNRIKKIEKLKKKPEKFSYNDFLGKCMDIVALGPRGIPSEHRGPTPEQKEKEKQLFADYPEHAAKFRQWVSDLENR